VRAGSFLTQGFTLAHQRAGLIALDLLWKLIWLTVTSVLAAAAGFWLLADAAALFQGPELAASNPIMLAMAFDQFWRRFSWKLLLAFGGISAAGGLLWMILEALFRGGRRDFWTFFASSVVRWMILAPSAFLLVFAVYWDQSRGTLAVAAVVMCAIWFATFTAETLIRKNALALLGVDLFSVTAALGVLWILEAAAIGAVAAVSAAVFQQVSLPVEFLAAAGFAAAGLVLLAMFRSYLFVVRFSTIDIMRSHVLDV